MGQISFLFLRSRARRHGVMLVPAGIKIAKSTSNDTDYETDGNGYIPIDGGNVNGSAYTMVSGQSTHFPTTPDSNATNLPADDGQLVHLLASLPTDVGAGWQAQLTVQNNGRGRVKFWKDRRKQNEFMVGTPVALSSFPKDLYVEGTVPGAAQQEIVLKLQIIIGSQTVDANSIKLTVTPIITNYQAYAVFNDSPVYSPVLGQPFLFSGASNGIDENILVSATVFHKNILGRLQHIQTLAIGFLGGRAAAIYPGDPATTSPLHTYIWQYAPPSDGRTLVDLSDDSNFPYYKLDASPLQSGDTAVVSIEDNPSASLQAIKPTGSQISVLDMTWAFTDYAVWVYPDGTAYPLGQTTWSVRWAGKLAVVLTNSIVWAASSNNANNVGQAFTPNNTAPTVNLPSAIDAFNGTGAGFQ